MNDENVFEWNGELESLYSPGLTKRTDKPYVRDSTGGVLLLKVNGVKMAVPVECKGRVSVNTFHWTVAWFNRKHGLPDMPRLGSDANRAKRYNIWDDDEHLLGLVQEYLDQWQNGTP